MKFSLGGYKYYILVVFLLVLLIFVGLFTHYSKPKHYMSTGSFQQKSYSDQDSNHSNGKEVEREELWGEIYPMGSSLPDCSHACGVCSPCKRVMISFNCASESCPIVYRCLCHGKFYHVPSSS